MTKGHNAKHVSQPTQENQDRKNQKVNREGNLKSNFSGFNID